MEQIRSSKLRYPNDRAARIDAALRDEGVSEDIIGKIMAGGEGISGSKRPATVAWLRGAMERMDALLDYETRVKVRDAYPCCLGGERGKLAKKLARENDTLEARISAANEARFLFGHSVTQQPDGRLLVQFQPPDAQPYRCSCLGAVVGSVSLTYCMCCGGHVRRHLQTVLGRALTCDVQTSALASAGEDACTFLLTMVG